MSSPMLSAGLITATTLQISGAQAGAIQATNLDFDNLNTTINGVSSTVKGSRKIAKSPFHLPTLRGPYAVDLHNITTWAQTESGCTIKKSTGFSPELTAIYEAIPGKMPAEVVSDTIISDGSGYDVPTKYGIKRLVLEDGDCFYDSSKQLFMTPMYPVTMSVFLPSMRDPTEEFNYFEENPVNYHGQHHSGSILMKLYYKDFPNVFMDDTADDSVSTLFLNYDFSTFTEDDLTKDTSGNIIDADLLTTIIDSQAIATDSDGNRHKFIVNVLNLFKDSLNPSTRLDTLLTAFKATGSYRRLMSYKWYVKRFSEYTDTSGNLSTDLSQTTLPPGGKVPFLMGQWTGQQVPMELASRGIACVNYSFDYGTQGYARVPNSNSLDVFKGALIYNGVVNQILTDKTVRDERCSGTWADQYDMAYNLDNTHLISERNYTTIDSTQYGIGVLRTMYNIFVETGLTDYLDTDRVSCIGWSGNGAQGNCANVIMEKYQSTFPMKFVCVVAIDSVLNMPANFTPQDGSEPYGDDYPGTFYKTQQTMPNGLSIPMLWFDEVHDYYEKFDDIQNVGPQEGLQTLFRKTYVTIRSECMYSEFGDTHSVRDPNPYRETYAKTPFLEPQYTKANGSHYPDDSITNLSLNETNVSVEEQHFFEGIRFCIGTVLFICRHSQPFYPVSKELIKSILPGTITISPYTLDDAGQYADNFVIHDSVTLPKIIKTYDSSVYDFVHNTPGNSTYCFDLSQLTSVNQSFSLQGLPPTGEISKITVTTRGVTYNDTSGQISEYTPLSTIISYVPHADMDGFADTSGIDFVRGDAPNGSWKITELDGELCFVSGDVGISGTPGDDGSVIMNITIPEVSSDNVLSFVAIARSETSYDFLAIYINDELLETLSGDTRSDYNIPVVTGDIIKISYSKDYIFSARDDVIYIKNLSIRTGGNYNIINVGPSTKPKCDFITTLYDFESITTSVTLPDSRATPVVISPNDVVRSVQIIPKDNLAITGKLIVNVEYFKIPPADSVIMLNI